MLVSSPAFTLNINDLAFCSKISLLLSANEKTYFLWQMLINTKTSTDESSENKSLEGSALNTHIYCAPFTKIELSLWKRVWKSC